MNDIDHMLNGRGSRRHHQDMIQEARRNRMARDVSTAQGEQKTIAPIRAALIAVINWIIR